MTIPKKNKGLLFQKKAKKTTSIKQSLKTYVKGVVNSIQIKSADFDRIEKRAIESAIHRNSSLQDKDIEVAVSGNAVTLTGTVTSHFQKEEAERIAWNSPSVWTVNNLLVVQQSKTTSIINTILNVKHNICNPT